ncbi:hypothetical protein AB0L70_06840 [Kribbella sp. NPDC051952]|uniref:hypothetical protein n=1 Tax=Kribbella sp. NPDC051952 TaxID=3154851 RepID=UPI003428DD7E
MSAEDLHQALEAEIRSMSNGADWARWLDVAALLPSYGFGNVVLINLQMPQANWVAREQAWEKLGRRVRKQNAIRILQPIFSQTSMGAALQAASRTLAANGQLGQHVVGFKVASVYDVTATVGPPIHLPRPSQPGRTVPNVCGTRWRERPSAMVSPWTFGRPEMDPRDSRTTTPRSSLSPITLTISPP